MDNLGWDNPSILRSIEINSMPPTIWNNQYYDINFSDSDADYSKVELDEALLIDSSLELHGDSIDLDRVNEMVEMLAPAFDSVSDRASDPGYFLQHDQLSSPPLTISPENFATTQELENFNGNIDDGGIAVLFQPNLSCSGNLSSSGESEAVSDHSSRSRHGGKRKVEDNYLSSSSRGFQIFFDSVSESKKPRISTENESVSTNIDFRRENKSGYEPDTEAIAHVKEMMYRAAALRPVNLVVEDLAFAKQKRKNVRISSDPQTVAARQRRERISDRLRILQKMVPGGSKMDTASMLDEAANYLKFLKSQVTALETLAAQ